MLRIKPGRREMGCPPGGWEEVEPITGLPARGESLAGLAYDERRLLTMNGKEVPLDLMAQIEARFCQKLPADWVYETDPKKTDTITGRKKVIVLRDSVDKKTSAILDAWNKAGRPKLDAAEAERRAAMCIKCEAHAPIGCLTCDGTYQHLQQRMGAFRTSVDKRLQVCSVDQVFCKVQVWLAPAVMKRLMPTVGRLKLDRYPETCWKRIMLTPPSEQTETRVEP